MKILYTKSELLFEIENFGRMRRTVEHVQRIVPYPTLGKAVHINQEFIE